MNRNEFENLRLEAEEKLRSERSELQPFAQKDLMELFHELDVYRTELELQNDELRKTQTELETSRLRYADLYDFAPVSYLTLSDKGLIVEANLTASTELNTARGILLGKPFTLFIEKADKDVHYRHLKKIFSSGKPLSCELRLRPKGKEPFHAELTSCLFETPSGESFCRTTLINIDERKRAERLLREAKEDLALKVAERTLELNEKNEALQREMEEHRLDEERLRQTASNLAEAQRMAHLGSWEWDIASKELSCSDEACRIFGLDRRKGKAGYRAFLKTLHPEDREAVNKAVGEALSRKRPFELDHRIILPDGRVRSIVHETAEVILDDEKRPVMIKGTVQDITERKMMEEHLQKATIAAGAASKAKGSFLANMSHEIRSPMQSIVLMIDMLSDMPKTAEQEECIHILKKSGENLINLLSDILQFSKIEEGRVSLEEVDFDLMELVEKAVKPLKAEADRKGLALKKEYASDLPASVNGDPAKLQQILTNLISNAVKFTSEGEVAIGIKRDERSEGMKGTARESLNLLFTVNDTGIGIPEDKIGMIFDKFVQADSSITRKFGGTGLGTAICKGLVEIMGGHIWAENASGKGITFCFTLPFGIIQGKESSAEKKGSAKGAKNKGATETAPSKEPPPLSILLVEDSGDIRNLIGMLLANTAITLDMAENGEEGLHKFKSEPYDMVIMDIQMPVMDGLTAAGRMRLWEEEQGLKRTPLIALTAHAFKEDEAKCLNAGFNAYMAKPVSKKVLLKTICSYAPES